MTEKMEDEKETGRLEAFSDGVFAIAITLLVLDLKVPQVSDLSSHRGLSQILLSQWPTFLAFVSSFLTILVMWVNHHKLFQHIHRTTHSFLIINGLLLMGITIVPYPTALLAEYIRQPDAKLVAAVYSGLFIFIAIFYNLLWCYASKNGRLLRSDFDPRAIQAITTQYAFGPVFYLAAFILAFFSAAASVIVNVLLAVFFALPESITLQNRVSE